MEQVLITGGTGLVGKTITTLLKDQGYKVLYLSTRPDKSADIPRYGWNVAKQELDSQAFEGTDHIIHLAGAGVADKRWTSSRKKELYDSRIEGTKLIHKALKEGGFKPKSFLAASAVGFYGDRGSELMNEEAAAGCNFLAMICKDWEAESAKIADLGIRTTINRIGIVLANEGGALPEMMKTAPLGFLAYLGSGKQYYPWIHLKDLARIFVHQLQNENSSGIYNAVGKEPVTNYELTKAIARYSSKSYAVLPTPAFTLRIVLGEMADMVLASQKTSSEKLLSSGFSYEFEDLEAALKDLLA